MKQLRNILIGLVAASALTLAGCGGGGGGGGGGGAGDGGGGGAADPTPVTNTTFSVVPLGGLNGSFSAGIAINDGGMAVGFADNGSSIKGAKWTVTDADPVATALEPLPGNNYSAAYGVNSDGIAVGESGDFVAAVPDANTVAVFWIENAVPLLPTPLPAPADNQGAYAAYSINASDEIVGESVMDASGNTKAILWDSPESTSTMNDTLHQAGWDYSAAYFIHDDGVIVGEAKPASGPPQGVIWTPAPPPAAHGSYSPPLLLPPLTVGGSSVAFGIDDQGRVVGESETSAGVIHGVIWTVNTLGTEVTSQDLGANTSAQAVNDAERFVGYSGAGSLLWSLAKREDFKSLAPAFSQAYGINGANQVVGISDNRAFVAIPQ